MLINTFLNLWLDLVGTGQQQYFKGKPGHMILNTNDNHSSDSLLTFHNIEMLNKCLEVVERVHSEYGLTPGF